MHNVDAELSDLEGYFIHGGTLFVNRIVFSEEIRQNASYAPNQCEGREPNEVVTSLPSPEHNVGKEGARDQDQC